MKNKKDSITIQGRNFWKAKQMQNKIIHLNIAEQQIWTKLPFSIDSF